MNQVDGGNRSIGPVLDIDRSGQIALLFRQTNGYVPIGARFITVTVNIIRFVDTYSNGDVDNIAAYLYEWHVCIIVPVKIILFLA